MQWLLLPEKIFQIMGHLAGDSFSPFVQTNSRGIIPTFERSCFYDLPQMQRRQLYEQP
jgi:hypothetical protein